MLPFGCLILAGKPPNANDRTRLDSRANYAIYLGISDETNEKFVGMYVNQRTIDYGDDGREAVMRFLEEGQSIGLVDSNFDPRAIDFIGRADGR